MSGFSEYSVSYHPLIGGILTVLEEIFQSNSKVEPHIILALLSR